MYFISLLVLVTHSFAHLFTNPHMSGAAAGLGAQSRQGSFWPHRGYHAQTRGHGVRKATVGPKEGGVGSGRGGAAQGTAGEDLQAPRRVAARMTRERVTCHRTHLRGKGNRGNPDGPCKPSIPAVTSGTSWFISRGSVPQAPGPHLHTNTPSICVHYFSKERRWCSEKYTFI